MEFRRVPLNLAISRTIGSHVKWSDLVTRLSALRCPEDERCSAHIFETDGIDGVTILLKRRTSILADGRWASNHDPTLDLYAYQTVFNSESLESIVEAVREIFEAQANASS